MESTEEIAEETAAAAGMENAGPDKACAAETFKLLAGMANDCFKQINFADAGGINRVVREDMAKADTLPEDGGGHWQKMMVSVYSYYEKFFGLMDTLIVSDEDDFEKLETVCAHFGIPKRIFIKEFINCDTEALCAEAQKLCRILKNSLM